MLHFWPGILAGCLGGAAALSANLICLTMIARMNQQLPASEQISSFWWGSEVRHRFKRMFPSSKLVFMLDACVVAMVLCFIATIRFWVFG